MAKYAVPLSTGAFTSVYVDADSADEAREKVWDNPLPTVCAQCSGWGSSDPNTGLEIGDWDYSQWDEPVVVEDD